MVWRKLSPSEMSEQDAAETPPFGTFRPNAIQRLLIALCRHTLLKRGSARRLMTRLILTLGPSHLDIGFRGAAFRIHGKNNLIEYGLLLNPGYNAVEIDFLLKDADAHSNFVDIGCNIGLYALPLGVFAGSGKTLAIDANPKMVARISWNASASKARNVLVVSTAVGDVNGLCEIAIRRDDLAIVAVEVQSDGHIPMRRLSEVVAEAGLTSIHGLKIDIEGYEDKALAPFLDEAPRSLLPRKIVIEHPSMTADYPACADAFRRCGYRLVGRTRNNSMYELVP